MMEPQDTPESMNVTATCEEADTKRARADSPNVHPAEALWRECGLPEYFLGNGGSNTKLYAFYDRAATHPLAASPRASGDRRRLKEGMRD